MFGTAPAPRIAYACDTCDVEWWAGLNPAPCWNCGQPGELRNTPWFLAMTWTPTANPNPFERDEAA